MDVAGVIYHICVSQKLDLRFEDLIIGILLPFLKKLEKREDEMAVQVSCDARSEVVILVLRHGFAEFDAAEKEARSKTEEREKP